MRYLLITLLTLSTLVHAKPKHHFLWVMDNSGSMNDRRQTVNKNISIFIDKLATYGITEYEMGITTTDVFTFGGKLVSDKIISSASTNPKEEFNKVVNSIEDSSTSFWEQGLEASKLVADRMVVPNEPLVIIFVTDADDYSCAEECHGVEPEHNNTWKAFPIERYTDFYSGLKKSHGVDVTVFPIVGLPAGLCPIESFGLRYMKLRAGLPTNGVNGSICNSEIEKALDQIPVKLSEPVTLPAWTHNPLKVNALAKMPLFQDLSPFAIGNNLTFSIVSGPSWAVISPLGTLSGTPDSANIGENQFVVRITNTQGVNADTALVIAVSQTNEIPKWNVEYLDLGTVKVGQPFQLDVSKFAVDPDGDKMSFVLVSGPAWLRMSIDGVLSGIPSKNDVGHSKFTARVFDSFHSAASDITVYSNVTE